MADSSIVAIHAVAGGPRTILLPREYGVIDVVSGKVLTPAATSIDIELQTPDTRVFRLIPAGAGPRHPEKPSETTR